MSECIFCKIISGEVPSYQIWEDEKHLAFLSIFPNTPGFSVVVTKEHYDSYVADLPDEVLKDMSVAIKQVCKLIDDKLPDVGRTGVIWEGMGVNHIHAKLFPMHGTGDMKEWKEHKSNVDKVFTQYEGYISSHNGPAVSEEELREMAERIRD
ncbi:HIT family protein [Patescibacteria group bacterium]|nr:HIT family protein [Patescibacteria group bacterium]